jgi:hypothetical protein
MAITPGDLHNRRKHNPKQPEHYRLGLLRGHLPAHQRSMEVCRAARLPLPFCAAAKRSGGKQLMVEAQQHYAYLERELDGRDYFGVELWTNS